MIRIQFAWSTHYLHIGTYKEADTITTPKPQPKGEKEKPTTLPKGKKAIVLYHMKKLG